MKIILPLLLTFLIELTCCNNAFCFEQDLVLNPTKKENVEQSEQNPSDFVPKGYVIFDKIVGDLNKDGIEDCVLIIKGTDINKVITDEFRGELDRNRRGIIVLFKKNNQYELALKNEACFSSENEDGGVYFAPELSFEIKNGNFYAQFAHGRYGNWEYTFRYQNSDFILIGYDINYRSNFVSDWVTFDAVSINFLSKKKLKKEITNVTADGKETYKETWEKLTSKKLFILSEITDFDEIDMSKY